MTRHGGFRLTAGQIDALTKVAFTSGNDGKLHVNKDLIGKDPAVLAEHAGVKVPAGTQLLFGETGAEHPFVSEEQMMPFVPFVRVSNVDRAIALAKESEHGFGHTAILHSRDTTVMSQDGQDHGLHDLRGQRPVHRRPRAWAARACLSFSIAGPTGEGVTTPLTFCRQRRTAIIGGMRFM